MLSGSQGHSVVTRCTVHTAARHTDTFGAMVLHTSGSSLWSFAQPESILKGEAVRAHGPLSVLSWLRRAYMGLHVAAGICGVYLAASE